MSVSSGAPGAFDSGRYHIVRLLGRGGMGEVYLARDLTLPRDVALKFITSEHAADPDARRRLLREARAAAGLDHPSICTVYDAGETPDGRAYIAMQYVEGRPLTEILQQGPLPIRDALSLCADIADALDAAHAHGIVHRDLKPGNVMITASGRPKLVDFGIAKVMTSAASPQADTATAVTTAGTLVGTVGYMSPEQAQQLPLDGRSDLFSLGALLFECLTGRRAFQGETRLETLAQVLHVDPPPPSTLRSGLDERHDALCRGLLAKDPRDRFQSAQQVVGAIRLLITDTSGRRANDASGHRAAGIRSFVRRQGRMVALLAALFVVVVFAVVLARPRAENPPAEAERAYRRGTEALHEGAYFKASHALEEAVRIHPGYALAYARLAEARAELDDHRLAQESLLRIRLSSSAPKGERLRVDAIRALVLRNMDQAIATYGELARLNERDAGAWLDLGRAQESAGLRNDARASYARAVSTNAEYAPAYVRLGYVEALDSRRDAALAAFAQAERLYQASLDVEGLTEVLLRRGGMYDSFNELKAARGDLQRALSLAREVNASYQEVRARLLLSSVTASEGRFEEAVTEASGAVQDALTRGLGTVAAEGLIDLATIMQRAPAASATGAEGNHLNQAVAHAQRAAELAESRGARRTAARARVQLAAIYGEQNRSRDALDALSTVLPFLRENRFRRFELLALSIASRAHSSLDDLEQAQRISTDVLNVAETVEDDAQIALAASTLASVVTALGNYPDALRLRARVEEIHRRQGDEWSIPYDLANRADLLIRLGRRREAGEALATLDAGIAARRESYVGRVRHATFYRALAAATGLQCTEALTLLRRLSAPRGEIDTPGALAPAIASFCHARAGRLVRNEAPRNVTPTSRREQHYWAGAAAAQVRDWPGALAEATDGLALLGDRPNDELRWRLAAVAVIAARATENRDIVARLSDAMRASLGRLEARWGSDFPQYAAREDLADLRRRAERP